MPVLLAVWIASHIEKFMKKITPDVVKVFIVPFVTILISVPLTFLVVGPVANYASDLCLQALLRLWALVHYFMVFYLVLYGK